MLLSLDALLQGRMITVVGLAQGEEGVDRVEMGPVLSLSNLLIVFARFVGLLIWRA